MRSYCSVLKGAARFEIHPGSNRGSYLCGSTAGGCSSFGVQWLAGKSMRSGVVWKFLGRLWGK